jgi:hypothetical protein
LWSSEPMHPDYEAQMGPPGQHVIMEPDAAHMKADEPAEAFDPDAAPQANGKKRRARKAKIKEKKPKYRPGEIRISTALDGSTLYCCPECHLAYPDR